MRECERIRGCKRDGDGGREERERAREIKMMGS